MRHQDINYDNMVRKIAEAVPELKPYYERQIAYWRDEPPPVHTAYSQMVFDTLAAALRQSDRSQDDFLKRLFKFLELLATHPDKEIQNVVYVSVCEHICSDELVLQKSQNFMGKTTREFCRDIIKAKPLGDV